MQRFSSRKARLSMIPAAAVCSLAGVSVLTTGCANFKAAAPSTVKAQTVAIGGSVYGGRQPVDGALVAVYAAGNAGYGSAPTQLATTVSDANGGFSFPAGTYACPSSTSTAASQTLYITASGGSPTTGIVNPNAVLLAVIGDCSTVLTQQPFVAVNEATTIASAFALQQFMAINQAGNVTIGTSATNIIGLQNAAATVPNLVTLSSGQAITSTTVTGAIAGYSGGAPASITITPESSKLNTLADILASCVNSAGSTSGTCSTLFSDVNSTPAANTLQAAYYLAANPTSTVNGTSNIQALYNLVSPQSPYQSVLTSAPTDWTLGITYGSNSSATIGSNTAPTYLLYYPEYLAIDTGGNVWIANPVTSSAITAGNSVTELSPTGKPMNQVLTTAGQLAGPQALVIDPSSNVWVSNFGSTAALNNTIVEYTGSGTTNTFNTVNPGPGPLVSDGAGNIFFSTTGSYTTAIPTAGAADIEAISGTAASGTVATQLATNATAGRFSGLVVDGNETLYLSNQGTGTAQYLPVNGGPTYASQGISTGGASSTTYAEGLALDGNNNVYVANFAFSPGSPGSISELYSSNFMTGAGPFTAGSLGAVQRLLIDGAGNLWATSYPTTAGTLSEFTPAGVPLSPSATGFSHNFKGALGLAIDRSGNVWVGNYGAKPSPTAQAYINEVVGAAAPVVTPLSAELPGTPGNRTRIGQRP